MQQHLRKLIGLAIGLALTGSGLLATNTQAQAISLDLTASSSSARTVALGSLVSDASYPAALRTAMVNPSKNPSGANNWNCRPSLAHPYPVVLVHGTWANAYDDWNGLSQILTYYGYCVFAVNYGATTVLPFLGGTADMVDSAQEIAQFISRVLASTGAAKVDLIGHSQGGAQVRYFANLVGGAASVDQVIGISPSNHPTTGSGLTNLSKQLQLFGVAMGAMDFMHMPAIEQQADHSPGAQAPFYQQLNDFGETVPGLSYTNILTKNDEVVTPYTQGAITAGPGASVDNIVIQNVCPLDQSDHISMTYSKNVAQIVLNKLDPSDQRPIRCYAQAAVVGSTRPI